MILNYYSNICINPFYLETRKRVIAKVQTSHNVEPDQGLHCLLTGFSFENKSNTINPTPLK